jgi:hypothetical protein
MEERKFELTKDFGNCLRENVRSHGLGDFFFPKFI